MAKRITAREGLVAVRAWAADPGVERQVLATAVRYTLGVLAAEHPGGAVEIRIAPLGAVQALPGGNHRRGTPPNVVETDPQTWLQLATGRLTWGQAVAARRVDASGVRADLDGVLPVVDLG